MFTRGTSPLLVKECHKTKVRVTCKRDAFLESHLQLRKLEVGGWSLGQKVSQRVKEAGEIAEEGAL